MRPNLSKYDPEAKQWFYYDTFTNEDFATPANGAIVSDPPTDRRSFEMSQH